MPSTSSACDTEEIVSAGISGTGVNSPLTDCNQGGTPTFIHQRLATNAEYRMRFADRIHKWCFNDGRLSAAGMTDVCNRQFDEIDAAVRCESARWGDNRAPARPAPNTNVTYTRGIEWLNEKSRMLNTVIAGRPAVFLNSMKSKSNALYPRVDPAVTTSAIFHAPAYAQHGGRVPAGYHLTITNPNGGLGTIYYTLDGSDPRLTGGGISPTALELLRAGHSIRFHDTSARGSTTAASGPPSTKPPSPSEPSPPIRRI